MRMMRMFRAVLFQASAACCAACQCAVQRGRGGELEEDGAEHDPGKNHDHDWRVCWGVSGRENQRE